MSDDCLYIGDSFMLVCTTIEGPEVFKIATRFQLQNIAVSSTLFVAVGGNEDNSNGEIQVYNRDGVLQQRIEQNETVRLVTFDDSGQRFVCSSHQGYTAVFSCEDECNELVRWQISGFFSIQALLWINDSEICSGSNSGQIAIWDATTGSPIREIQPACTYGILRMARVMSNASMLITGHNTGTMRFWSLHDASYKEIVVTESWITAIVVAEDYNLVVASTDDRLVMGLDLESFNVRWHQSVQGKPTTLAVHNDELFVGMFYSKSIVLDINDGTLRRILPRKQTGWTLLAFPPSSSSHRGFKFAE